MKRVLKYFLGQKSKKTHRITLPYSRPLSGAANKPPYTRQSGVHKIDCESCHKSYIGETGRDLSTRVKEHTDDLRLGKKAESGIVNHNKETGHSFDFGNARIIFPCKNKKKMQIVESSLIWYFTRQNRAVNLNYGFAPKNMLFSYYIKKSVTKRRQY